MFLLALWGWVGLNAVNLRQAALAAAGRDTTNLARVVEGHAEQLLHGVDLLLASIIQDWRQEGAGFDFNRAVSRYAPVVGFPFNVFFADPSGRIVWSNVDVLMNRQVGDRLYFSGALAQHDRLVVGEPMVGRIKGDWRLPLARAVMAADGTLAGILVVSIDPTLLADFYGSIQLGRTGLVMLVGTDGVIRARSSALGATIGKSLEGKAHFPMVQASRSGIIPETVSPIDGVTRLISFRRLNDLPLSALVGVGHDEVLAPVWDDLIGHVVVAGCASIMLLLGFALIQRQVAQLAQAERDLSGQRQARALAERDALAARERAELTREIEQARKMEALGNLASGIAHDFNNLLLPIIGLAELTATKLPPDHAAQPNLATIRSAGEHARDLIAEILTCARNEPTALAPIDLATEIRRAAALIASLDGVRPQLDCPGEPLYVLGNAAQVGRIVINLLTNATHALRGRPDPRLTLALAVEPGEDGPEAVLRISDNGPGIEPATLSRIFEPYFTTKPRGEGTGLGLAVVHGIVTSWGGTLTASSRPGDGTTFTVRLPALTAEEAAALAEAEVMM